MRPEEVSVLHDSKAVTCSQTPDGRAATYGHEFNSSFRTSEIFSAPAVDELGSLFPAGEKRPCISLLIAAKRLNSAFSSAENVTPTM